MDARDHSDSDEDEEGADDDWLDYLEKKGQEKNWTQLQQLQKRIGSSYNICDNKNRRLYHEARLQRQARYKTVGRRGLLFNDLFILAKPLKNNRLQLKQVLDLRNLTINSHVKSHMKHSFMIQTPEREYVLGATSEEAKKEWTQALTKAMIDLEKQEAKTNDPLESAMAHLQGLLKAGEEDPALRNSVTQVLQLLDKVRRTAKGPSKFQKRMDKDLQKQAPDVADWLKAQFTNHERKPSAEPMPMPTVEEDRAEEVEGDGDQTGDEASVVDTNDDPASPTTGIRNSLIGPSSPGSPSKGDNIDPALKRPSTNGPTVAASLASSTAGTSVAASLAKEGAVAGNSASAGSAAATSHATTHRHGHGHGHAHKSKDAISGGGSGRWDKNRHKQSPSLKLARRIIELNRGISNPSLHSSGNSGDLGLTNGASATTTTTTTSTATGSEASNSQQAANPSDATSTSTSTTTSPLVITTTNADPSTTSTNTSTSTTTTTAAGGTMDSLEPVQAKEIIKRETLRLTNQPMQQIEFLMYGFTAKVLLKKADSWDDFDIFRLEEATMGRPLSVLCMHLFQQWELFDRFNIKVSDFSRFITAIETGYLEPAVVPYHNRLHACDVLQNIAVLLRQPSMRGVLALHDVLAALIAAAIHDFRHPGTTNNFHINAETPFATQFNDISVLESMHCSEAFKVMKIPGHDVLAPLTSHIKKEVRESIVTMVLATDMKKHFELHQFVHDFVATRKKQEEEERRKEVGHIGGQSSQTLLNTAQGAAPASGSPNTTSPPQLSGASSSNNLNTAVSTTATTTITTTSTTTTASGGRGTILGIAPGMKRIPFTRKERLLTLQAALHCSDLGNPAKPLAFYLKWTDMIMQEFFAQGDTERQMNLPISPMCDRLKPAIEKSQIGFITVIVKPLFNTFCELVPEMMKTCSTNLEFNNTYWVKELEKIGPEPAPVAAGASGPASPAANGVSATNAANANAANANANANANSNSTANNKSTAAPTTLTLASPSSQASSAPSSAPVSPATKATAPAHAHAGNEPPSPSPSSDRDEVLFEGHAKLLNKGTLSESWQPKWFVFLPDALLFYKTEKKDSKDLQGAILYHTLFYIQPVDENKEARVDVLIKVSKEAPTNVLHIHPPTTAERDLWVEILNVAARTCSLHHIQTPPLERGSSNLEAKFWNSAHEVMKVRGKGKSVSSMKIRELVTKSGVRR